MWDVNSFIYSLQNMTKLCGTLLSLIFPFRTQFYGYAQCTCVETSIRILTGKISIIQKFMQQNIIKLTKSQISLVVIYIYIYIYMHYRLFDIPQVQGHDTPSSNIIVYPLITFKVFRSSIYMKLGSITLLYSQNT